MSVPQHNTTGNLREWDLDDSVAGLVTALPENRAILLVREHISALLIDTLHYPLDELVAERLNVGWMVFVPTHHGAIAIDRALFYIADDGVIELSSSSIAPSIDIADFEQRFQRRRLGAAAGLSI